MDHLHMRRSFTALVSDPAIKTLFEHPGTVSLDCAFGRDWILRLSTIFDMLERFEAVHLKSSDGVTDLSMGEMFHTVHSYVVNRATAIILMQAHDYTIKDCFESKTDAAFSHFLRTLLEASQGLQDASPIHKKSITLDDSTTKGTAAFNIFTNQPLKFKVQLSLEGAMQPEETALFWFTRSAENLGAWDTEWEYVSKSYAVCFYGDEEYEF